MATEVESLIDRTIDSCLMRRGYRASIHRDEILKALDVAGYAIVEKSAIENSVNRILELEKKIDDLGYDLADYAVNAG